MRLLQRTFSNGSGVARSVAVFWTWWTGELAAWLPGRVRRAVSSARSTLAAKLESDHLLIARRGEGERSEPVRVDLAGMGEASRHAAVAAALARLRKGQREPITLLLSHRDATRKTIRLPVAARENLHEVLGFEMDRHTPFHADEVYYDQRLIRTETDPPAVVVELGFAPRDVVDRALEDARSWGLSPAGVRLARDRDDPGQDFNLVSERPPQTGSRFLASVNVLLAAAALALGAALVYLPLDRLNGEAERLAERIAFLKAEAKEGAAIRAQIETLGKERRFGTTQKIGRPPVVVSLERLTALLPKDSWVFQFQMTGSEIQIQGYSPDAARLVGLIENARHFRNAGFRSRVTRAPNSDAQRFHIAFDALPAP